jgi:hypothetical protein
MRKHCIKRFLMVDGGKTRWQLNNIEKKFSISIFIFNFALNYDGSHI